jgi:uncharacterized protein GlcG (DUF336 family)
VTGAGGHLLSLDRAENANLATTDIAIRKARTSTFCKAPTAYLTQAMQPGGPLYTAENTSAGLFAIPAASRLPTATATMIGATGISGEQLRHLRRLRMNRVAQSLSATARSSRSAREPQ